MNKEAALWLFRNLKIFLVTLIDMHFPFSLSYLNPQWAQNKINKKKEQNSKSKVTALVTMRAVQKLRAARYVSK